MAKTTARTGIAPFAHLLALVTGKTGKGSRADEGDLAPDDDEVVDQEEVDDALDDSDVEDVEDGPEPDKEAKGKKAKGKGAKPEDDDVGDDDAKAEEPEDEKEAKAFRRGLAAGRKRENARCKAIFSVDAAGVRPDVAAQLAFGTRQSAEEAVGLLNTVAAGGAVGGSLDARMGGRRDPNPGADGGQSGEPGFGAKVEAAKKKAGLA